MRLFEGLRPVTPAAFRRDALAGVTLASMNMAQVLGYARIAGTPVVTGLYTALWPVLAFAVFGSSRHLVVAADSATAAILASSLSSMAAPESAQYLALVAMVAFLTAALLLVARIFRLGFLADFLSRTVLVGFLSGVGVQVAIAMLGGMSGVAVHSARSTAQLWELSQRLPEVHVPTLALSLLVTASILLGHRLLPRLPLALLVVAASIAASAALDFPERGIAVIGPVSGGLPSFAFPALSWRASLAVLPVAVSCFVMIIAQSSATSRAFAAPCHEHVDSDADILGLSAANAAAALTGAFVVNGSPTQTAMANAAGARSQVAQLVFAGVVLAVLIGLTGPLQHLPRCVLASVVFTIAIGMVDVSGLRAIRRESPGEFQLALLTAIAVIAIGVEQGILLAVALSLLRHVRHSYHPHTAILRWDEAGRRQLVPALPGVETEPGLVVYHFGADLFYANEGRFTDEVRAVVASTPHPARWLVVDGSPITDIDYSAAKSLRDLIADLRRRGVAVVFARVAPELRADMDRHGITEALGGSRVFATLHEALAAVRSARPESDQ